VVEGSNLTVQISALRRVLDQRRSQGSCIQTVAGRGYRFVEAVIHPGTGPSSGTAIVSGNDASPRLSIVVLPFANLSDDREQQYFADGITEDLTTDLSRIAETPAGKAAYLEDRHASLTEACKAYRRGSRDAASSDTDRLTDDDDDPDWRPIRCRRRSGSTTMMIRRFLSRVDAQGAGARRRTRHHSGPGVRKIARQSRARREKCGEMRSGAVMYTPTGGHFPVVSITDRG
jgi:hypothetical protein